MIKQFNTAIGSAAGSGPAAKSKAGNALIWVAALTLVVFVGYKFIESRNTIVNDQNN
jgi:hypothetical protein